MPNKTTPATKAKRFRRAEVPAYLKLEWGLSYSSKTLAKLATLGGGPPMEYDGRRPLYPQDGLDAWAAAKIGPRVNSTPYRPRASVAA
jgi:hypothetical protein